jgi:PP-loop superfamily ATP-utilizing enzyme
MKNIAEVSEKELEKLENCEPFFRELVNKKKFRVLNHIPASYVPPAEQINNAHKEADDLRAENEVLKARLAALEKSEKAETKADDGLEGDRGRDAVAGVEDAPAEEPKKTSSSKKGKK